MANGESTQDKDHCQACGKKECNSCANSHQMTERKRMRFCNKCGRNLKEPCSVCRPDSWLEKLYDSKSNQYVSPEFLVYLLVSYVLWIFDPQSFLDHLMVLVINSWILLISYSVRSSNSNRRVRLYHPPTGNYLGVDIMVENEKDRKLYTSVEGFDLLRECMVNRKGSLCTPSLNRTSLRTIPDSDLGGARKLQTIPDSDLEFMFPGLFEKEATPDLAHSTECQTPRDLVIPPKMLMEEEIKAHGGLSQLIDKIMTDKATKSFGLSSIQKGVLVILLRKLFLHPYLNGLTTENTEAEIRVMIKQAMKTITPALSNQENSNTKPLLEKTEAKAS